MGEIINVKTAELAVAHNDAVIKTGSVGSCVVVVLFDEKHHVGGLAHAMLPSRREENEFSIDTSQDPAPAKYVDEAIDNLLAALEKIGGKKNDLIAKIIGGASMFKRLHTISGAIGKRNVEVAKNRLKALEIPLEGEDTGGSTGKIVELNLANGVISVSTRI